jgi:hypothetical protein
MCFLNSFFFSSMLLLSLSLYSSASSFAGDAVDTSLPSLKIARVNPSVLVRSDGRVYVAGGTDAQNHFVYETEVYDLATGSDSLPFQPPPAFSATGESIVFLSRDRILFCFGTNCEVYDPALNTSPTFKLPGGTGNSLLSSSYAVLADGNILRAGGEDPLGSISNTYLIDSESFAAKRVGNMVFSSYDNNFVMLSDGRVFAPGGQWLIVGPFPAIPIPWELAQIYDPHTQTWNEVSPMAFHRGTVQAVVLADGRVLVGGGDTNNNPDAYAEIYDPANNSWTLAQGVKWSGFGKAVLLPNGSVLINDQDQTTIWNPTTGEVRQGRAPAIPRFGQGLVVLPNGAVLAIGGGALGNGGTQVLSSVEVLSFPAPDPPKTTLSLNPNFYVVTANQSSAKDDGLCGIQATYPGYTSGGMFFGGLLAAQGSEVAFASFSITETQTVTVHADLFPLPNSSGNLDVTLRMLDVNKNPVAPGASGTGSVTWSGQLAAGFYVAELRSGANAPAMAVNASVSATRLQGGISAGASLAWSADVTAYLAFSLADNQDVNFQLSNQQSYGIGRGAGSVILTIQDGAGTILKKLGPDGIDLQP